MKLKPISIVSITTLALSTILSIGCSSDQKSKTTNDDEASVVQNPSTIADIWLDAAPPNSIPVSEARGCKPGETIVVEAVIGGVHHPFSDDFAVMVVADDAIVFCNEMGDDDHCSMPWDACCEDPEKLKSSRATIQIVSKDGFPLENSLKGLAGLKELDFLIIQGQVAEASTEDNLIINATGIYRKS